MMSSIASVLIVIKNIVITFILTSAADYHLTFVFIFICVCC